MMAMKTPHTFAGSGTIESVQIERPGGAANTPDLATDGVSTRAQQV